MRVTSKFQPQKKKKRGSKRNGRVQLREIREQTIRGEKRLPIDHVFILWAQTSHSIFILWTWI